jgi:hypothetical protein
MALKAIKIGLFISSASAENTYLYNRPKSISASTYAQPICLTMNNHLENEIQAIDQP